MSKSKKEKKGKRRKEINSVFDLAPNILYLAGYLEGEAMFTYYYRTKPTGEKAFYPRIMFSTRDKDVADRIASWFGTKPCRLIKNRKVSDSVTWQVCKVGKWASHIMIKVLPYMSKRKSRAIKEVLSNCKLEDYQYHDHWHSPSAAPAILDQDI